MSQTTSRPATSKPVDAKEDEKKKAKVWPRWDPRDVDELPGAAEGTAPALPAVIEPPASSPLLVDEPIRRAVLAVEQRNVAQLLSPSGTWRTVALDGKYPRLHLSPNGTRLAVDYYGDSRSEVAVHDLASGKARTLRPPREFVRSEETEWDFLNEDELMLNGSKSFVFAIASGTSEVLPYPIDGLSRAVDPAGNVLVSNQWGGPRVLMDHQADPPVKVSMNLTGRLSSMRADRDTVVGTSYDKGPFAVIVADRKSLTPRAILPVLDFEGNYSNWGLGTLALVANGRVLLRVAAIGKGQTGFRVVAWNPNNGDLSVVSSTTLPATASVAFAEGLLRGAPRS